MSLKIQLQIFDNAKTNDETIILEIQQQLLLFINVAALKKLSIATIA